MDTIAPSLSPLRLFGGGGDGAGGSPLSSSAAANTAVVAPGVALFDLSSSPSIASAASAAAVRLWRNYDRDNKGYFEYKDFVNRVAPKHDLNASVF